MNNVFTKETEIWDQIYRKAKSHEEETLTEEQKELIIQRYIDQEQVRLWHSSDEQLLKLVMENFI